MFSSTKKIHDIIRSAWILQLDISRDYFRKAPERVHQLQSGLIRATRDVYIDATSFLGHSYEENKKNLYALYHARQSLRHHSFQHVIDGRIATIVQCAMKKEEIVPPEFIDDYLFFTFESWHTPSLNYYSVVDL